MPTALENPPPVDMLARRMAAMSLYHLLDPFWTRFPWPGTVGVRVDEMAGIVRIRLVRRYRGRELMPVYCYAVGDTLVDSGMPAAARQVLELARQRGVRRAFITHHHEDHAGNAAPLMEAGVDVMAAPLTARLLAHDMPLPFYQHLVWGRTRPVAVREAGGATVALGPYEARVVAAPGHAVDQVVLHLPEQGWLFSGDVFIHERIKVFRRDEDFAATVATLERLLELDFDTLFCGHRPVAAGGKAALARKLAWLRELEEGARHHHAQGLSAGEIVRRLGIVSRDGMATLTLGDASPANLVRSILHGPTVRREVSRVLATAPAAGR